MRPARATRSNVTVFVLSLVVALLVAEGLVRLALPQPGFFALPVAEIGGVLVPHPERGHAYAPNLRRHFGTDDYEIDFETNGLGMRDGAVDNEVGDRLRVLAVGDSFTQGHGVQATAAWPKQLEARLPGSRVYNTGVSGYGLQQMRATAELLVHEFRPDLIAIGLYGYGYTRLTDPFVIVGDGGGLVRQSRVSSVQAVEGGVLIAAFQTPTLRDITFWCDRHWHLAAHALHLVARAWSWVQHARDGRGRRAESHSTDLPDAMNPLLEELARFQRFADDREIPLVALLINPQELDGSYAPVQWRYNEIILAYARDREICVVDPLPRMVELAAGRPVFRSASDKHWSPAAHALAVDVLLSSLLAQSDTSSDWISRDSACRAVRAALDPTSPTRDAQHPQ